MKIEETRALVTGGASGMGREFVRALAAEGAWVAFCDVNAEGVAATEAEFKDTGRVKGFVADVSNEDDVIKLINEAHAALGGRLDALVNNAGIFRDGLLVKLDAETGTVKKMSLKHWNQVIGVDLTGPFLCTREFAARIIETRAPGGVVVNISSVSRHGNVGQSNYSAAKAGLVADTKLWAQELARYGIRVGAVAPGFIDTPILQGMRPEVLEGLLKSVPLRRAGKPHEIYQAVKFIIECEYFTGRCIDVDGGITI
jgi:3-oxoacyl-[acyl-carrier protein] reductase